MPEEACAHCDVKLNRADSQATGYRTATRPNECMGTSLSEGQVVAAPEVAGTHRVMSAPPEYGCRDADEQ